MLKFMNKILIYFLKFTSNVIEILVITKIKTKTVLDFVMDQIILWNGLHFKPICSIKSIVLYSSGSQKSGFKRICSLGPTQFKWFDIIFHGHLYPALSLLFRTSLIDFGKSIHLYSRMDFVKYRANGH